MQEQALNATPEPCPECGRPTTLPCRSTREMEEVSQPGCRAMLMMHGGGERTADRLAAGKWHATLLFAGFRAGHVSQGEADAAQALAEMARFGLTRRDADGTWRDLTPEGERAEIERGLAETYLADLTPDGLMATRAGSYGVLGRRPQAT